MTLSGVTAITYVPDLVEWFYLSDLTENVKHEIDKDFRENRCLKIVAFSALKQRKISVLDILDIKFYRLVSLYNQQVASFCDFVKWGGRKENRCHMSFTEEKRFLQSQETMALQR